MKKAKDRDIIRVTAPYKVDNLFNGFGDYDRLRCESSRAAGTVAPVKRRWSLLGKAPRIEDKPLRGIQITRVLDSFFRQHASHEVIADFSTALYAKRMKKVI